MTMVWFEGWEAMDSATLEDYYSIAGSSVQIDASPPTGRSGKSLYIDGNQDLYVPIPDEASFVFGVALQKSVAGDQGAILQIRDGGGNAQCSIVWTSTGAFEMRRSTNVVLSTSAPSYGAGIWHYLEAKITVGNSGSWEIRVNGVAITSGSGDTQAQGAASVGQWWISGNTGDAFWFDDCYFLTQSGSAPYNDFLGDVTVESIVPDGAGTTTDWTPSTGSNWENVDERPHDDDTTYNSASTVGDTDLYTMGSIAAGAADTIYGVQSKVVIKKETAGARIIRPVIRTGGTNFEGDDFGPTTSYTVDRYVWEQNPDTTAAWTNTEVNAIEVGQKVQS